MLTFYYIPKTSVLTFFYFITFIVIVYLLSKNKSIILHSKLLLNKSYKVILLIGLVSYIFNYYYYYAYFLYI